MVSLKNSPGRASTEPNRLGLLVKRHKARSDEGVSELPDLGRLSCLRHLYLLLSRSSPAVANGERYRFMDAIAVI